MQAATNHSTMNKAELTRERILVAATELFASRGYDGASIRDIEQKGGVNRGLVTYHFGNKQDIWKAAFNHTFLPYMDDLRSKADLLRSLDARTRMRLMLENFVRMSAARPYMNQLMIQENYESSWRSEWIIEHFLKPAREFNSTFGDDDDPMRKLESEPHLRYAILGACVIPFSLPCEVRAMYGQDVSSEAFIENHIETVLKIVDVLLAE